MEHDLRLDHQQPVADQRHCDVRQLLADQKFEPGDRRDIEVGDRAKLLLAHDTERHQNGRDENQQDGDHRRHHGVDALDVLVVAETGNDVGGVAGADAGVFKNQALHVLQVHALRVAAYRFTAIGHGAVDPQADLRPVATPQVAAEARRNIDDQRQFAILHPSLKVDIIGDRRLLDEIARTVNILDIGPAFRRLVAVERREAQAFDVQRNPEAEHEHQQHRAEQRKSEANRIASQLQRFAVGIAEQTTQAEDGTAGAAISTRTAHPDASRFLAIFRVHRSSGPRRRRVRFLRPRRFLQIADERGFERRLAPRGTQARRSIAGQHLAGMHQRNAITALGLVHEVGRDENGDALLARQLDQQGPELVACDRIDAGRRLVENQQFRFMHHRHRQ